jgi:xylan 1,4-beta-xylosidase
VTPPKSHKQWYDLIYALVTHLVERYGIDEVRSWPFEVWNEPNNPPFWTGTQNEYFELYNTTARAIKKVDQSLRVGGPATMQSQWVSDFLKFCRTNNVPVDFVTTHEYPTDIVPLRRDIMKKVLTQTRSEAGGLPVYYTEYNAGLGDYGLGTEFYQDTSYPAAFVVKNIADVYGLVEIFSYWTFSDIFEEQGMKSQPFNGAFGMSNIHGISKPVWRAFELLHKAGDYRLGVTYSQEAGQSTVDVLATIDSKQQEVMMFVTNIDVPTNKPQTYSVQITVTSCTPVPNSATIQRVDENNANAYTVWNQMNRPTYPNKQQLDKLFESSKLESETIQFQQQSFNLHMPVYSLAVITFKCQ